MFTFVDGTNTNAATDHYISGARIQIVDDNHIESVWQSYSGRDEVGTMVFHLARGD